MTAGETAPKRQEGRPSVLAIHPGALGDVILFGRMLAEAPGPVTLVAGGEKARLLAGCGVVDAVLDFESLPMHEVFSDTPIADCALPGLLGGRDRLISCFAEGDPQAQRRLAELCGASESVFLPIRPPAEFSEHLLKLWADLLPSEWALPPCPTDPAAVSPWPVPQGSRDEGGSALQAAGVDLARPYAVIHPGAGAEGKCWPLERFLAVGAAMSEAGLGVAFVLGPVEADRWRDGRLARIRSGFPVLIGPPLNVLAGALAGAAAYLGNDSGVSHLAAAVGAPALVLFGPTNPRHFRPIGPRVGLFTAREMQGIAPMQVLAVLRQWLG